MPNRNTNKSPKKLWKTPSPSKPSLSRPNLQFADLEANTLEELSIEDLSSVSGGDGGQGIKISDEFRLTSLPINKNTPAPTNPTQSSSLDLSGLVGNGVEVLGSSSSQDRETFTSVLYVECPAVGPCSFVRASPYLG